MFFLENKSSGNFPKITSKLYQQLWRQQVFAERWKWTMFQRILKRGSKPVKAFLSSPRANLRTVSYTIWQTRTCFFIFLLILYVVLTTCTSIWGEKDIRQLTPISFEEYQQRVLSKAQRMADVKTVLRQDVQPSWLALSSDSYLTDKKFYLACFAIFRNEETQLEEWITHYLSTGVEHFFLIDHGPSTDSSAKILSKFSKELVTRWVFTDRDPGAQARAYHKFFPQVKAQTEWMIMADVDEYVTTASGESGRATLLKHFEHKADYVQIPGLFFGSSGLKKQPENVLCHFRKRGNYSRWTKHRWMNPALTKYWLRTSVIKHVADINIHHSYSIPGSRRYWSNGTMITNEAISVQLNESSIAHNFLLLNHHYRIMSEEYYVDIRGKRGNVMAGNFTLTREHALREMRAYDGIYNDIVDTTLSRNSPYCLDFNPRNQRRVIEAK